MTDRATPVLSRAQAFKIADAAARAIEAEEYHVHYGPNIGPVTTEDMRTLLFLRLSQRFAAPSPAAPAIDLQATATEMAFSGGSFVQALGMALLRADADNKARIVAAFPELIDRYSKISTNRKSGTCYPFCDGRVGADGFCGKCGLTPNGYDRDGNRREYF